MQKPEYFLTILVITGIWKGVGWGIMLYMAELLTMNEIYTRLKKLMELIGETRLGT